MCVPMGRGRGCMVPDALAKGRGRGCMVPDALAKGSRRNFQ